jgi:hypothetical protein
MPTDSLDRFDADVGDLSNLFIAGERRFGHRED